MQLTRIRQGRLLHPEICRWMRAHRSAQNRAERLTATLLPDTTQSQAQQGRGPSARLPAGFQCGSHQPSSSPERGISALGRYGPLPASRRKQPPAQSLMLLHAAASVELHRQRLRNSPRPATGPRISTPSTTFASESTTLARGRRRLAIVGARIRRSPSCHESRMMTAALPDRGRPKPSRSPIATSYDRACPAFRADLDVGTIKIDRGIGDQPASIGRLIVQDDSLPPSSE